MTVGVPPTRDDRSARLFGSVLLERERRGGHATLLPTFRASSLGGRSLVTKDCQN
jgi:hypothetical protein